MKHKVKVTVIDKKHIQSCSSSIVQILILACVPAITWVMSSSLRETRTMTISGMVV
jgi:hypothetical protein